MTDWAGLLNELESLLVEQLCQAQSGRLDDLAASVQRAGELADRIGAACGPQDGRRGEQIERVRSLHKQLCLTLAGRKQELADKLTKMRRGKSMLRVYRESPGQAHP